MKIIKRNGSEAVFDITKIIAALNKANAAVPENARMDQEQILGIAATIEEDCVRMNRAPSVEEIQELVETAIMNEAPSRWRSSTSAIAIPARWCAAPTPPTTASSA